MIDLNVTRALYDALMAARPFVEATLDRRRGLLLAGESEVDAELLERVDAALADAGELLSGVTS